MSDSCPRMWGFQAAGAAPLVQGSPVTSPETIATAIRIGNPASWDAAIAAREESDGLIDSVTDDEISQCLSIAGFDRRSVLRTVKCCRCRGSVEGQEPGSS